MKFRYQAHECFDAYKACGMVPVRGVWFGSMGDYPCGWPLSAILSTLRPGFVCLDEARLIARISERDGALFADYHAARLLDLTITQVRSFHAGFDGIASSYPTELDFDAWQAGSRTWSLVKPMAEGRS